jgi:CheY-like chemotaxis protein
MMNPAIARLLIVDDEAALMTALCDTLQIEGYATAGFTSARDALAELAKHQFDVLLTDLMMPEMASRCCALPSRSIGTWPAS